MTVIVAPSPADVAIELARYIAGLADEAIAQRGRFVVASSGGSLPKILIEALSAAVTRGEDLQTEKWIVFYADERVVPLDHADSNHSAHSGLYSQSWWKAPQASIHPIDPTLSPAECAKEYETRIRSVLGGGSLVGSIPAFDLVLLGMGPDGHTASLFPGHPLLTEQTRFIAEITDSPKPPPTRVTFTYPLLSGSRAVAVVSTGEGKAEALATCFNAEVPSDQQLPVARVRAAGGTVGPTWFLDAPAASKLPSQ